MHGKRPTDNFSANHKGHRQRLRDKFRASGLDAFMDHEVLEFLLTYAIPRRDTKPIAWEMIKKFGSLSAALDAKPHELAEVEGLGEEAALYVTFLRALLRRYFFDEIKQRETIKSPEDVVQYCRASLEGEKDEIFEVIYLTTRNSVIGTEQVSSGTIDRTSVSPRRVVENALKARAAALIFVHNHPSGNPYPSKEDICLTEELMRAANTLGLSVHDHLIVGKNSYYSFKANGLLPADQPEQKEDKE